MEPCQQRQQSPLLNRGELSIIVQQEQLLATQVARRSVLAANVLDKRPWMTRECVAKAAQPFDSEPSPSRFEVTYLLVCRASETRECVKREATRFA
jgi:hypothetical protein